MSKITIAIDGYSSTGKSTVARQLAKALDYIYVDSGAMYRAITLFALQNDLIGKEQEGVDKAGLISLLPGIRLEFRKNHETGKADIWLNGENVEQDIRKMEVSSFVSMVSALPEVRKKLVEQQRLLGKDKGVVMDGRDIGTVVFPDAELKLFMTASPKIRATRRYKELLEKGETITYEEVLQNVESRDLADSTRKDSPLIKADDAVEIDNSDMGEKEQFERILNHARNLIKGEA
ncbi:(d)CMP kinase [Robertkochia marina]|uniref:Cytidylate kinase n=1 Tax=Robertkochia marina TaxID=1227945 RepID=A0A4S3M0F0_9FLAO|nr:(d)CMP kinase [Robertkochia marina]THD67517.1 (d)CMP kinase [Robertkochia marina]TRZ44616.1 (d)CMP kinase [Robertkochia marina]